MDKESMVNNNLIKNKLMIAILVGTIIGLVTTKFASNGPFALFSNNPLVDFIYMITIILFSAFLLYSLANRISKKLVILIVVALFLRIMIVFIMSFFGLLSYQYDDNWDVEAFILLPDWYAGNYHFVVDGESVGVYSKLTLIVYFLFGKNPVYMQLLNAFFSALTIYYLYKITNHLMNEKTAYIVAVMMAVWPSYIYFSSMHMREAFAIYFIVALIFYFTQWLSTFKLRYLVISSFFIILSSLIRSQNAVLMVIIILPFIFYYTWIHSNKYLKVIILFITISLAVTVFIVLEVTGYLRYFNFGYIATEMDYRADGGSGYLEWMTYGSIIDVIIYAPIRLFYFVYTPFPWQVTNLAQGAAFFEAIILISMSYFILKYFKRFWEDYQYKRELFFIIVFCIVGLIANGIVDSNVGTALRHKLQYLFLFFILFNAIRHKMKENIHNP